MTGPGSALELRTYPPYLPEDRAQIAAFLASRALAWDEGEAVDYTVALMEGERMVGVGSLAGRVIKGLAVEEGLAGSGLALRLMSELEAEASRRGVLGPFVFTSPANRSIFESIGYRMVGEAPGEALLLEKGGGVERWQAELRALAASPARLSPRGRGSAGPEGAAGPVAALVMNCNPFTLGHLHLVKAAASSSSRVFLLVVAEDASSFPFEVRLRLVREGVASLGNVVVVPGSDYVVSRATFPAYFLKDRASEAARVHARLDADVFGRRIAPALGVTRRLVGEEPFSPVTAAYNRAMREWLPSYGVEVVEIPRLVDGAGRAVSASTVRRLIKEGRLGEARSLVPESTWKYLASPEAAPVLELVAASEGRH